MSWVKAKAKPQYNLDDFKDVDEDAIIEELTEEELLELNAAIDPEVSCLDFGVCGGMLLRVPQLFLAFCVRRSLHDTQLCVVLPLCWRNVYLSFEGQNINVT